MPAKRKCPSRFVLFLLLCFLLKALSAASPVVITALHANDGEALVERLPAWPQLVSNYTGKPLEESTLEQLRGDLLTALGEAGHLFATVEFPQESWPEGIVCVVVHCVERGEIRVRRAGRYYTPRQVIAKLTGRGAAFNYAEFCQRLAAANSEDLRIDVTLKPIYRAERLVMDAEVEYTDKLPLHASLEVTNAAAPEAKSPIQLRLGLQALNLAHCDDTLTLHYLTNGDFAGEVNAFYGSYQLPLGDNWHVTAFGSWSDSTYDGVVRDLDLQGRGNSGGLQLGRVLFANGRRRATIVFGWRLARTRNRLRLYSDSLGLSTARVSMPYLTVDYTEGTPDKWNGLNFASLTMSGNWAGHFGASRTRAFAAEGRGADGTFLQLRFNAARLQRLFSGEEAPGRWSLFARLQGLYSNDAAPNASREYLGGYSELRGYREAEVSGDTCLAGTLELRTPVVGGTLHEEAATHSWLPKGRLAAHLFTDFGSIRSHGDHNATANGRPGTQHLLSVGAGFRLAIGKGCLATMEYGLPICRHASPDTPRHGRWHLALQLHF